MAEIEKLIRGLGSSRWEARRAASEALANLGSPAVGPLIDALRDKNPDVRWAAIRALGKLGDPVAVKSIIKALRDEDSGVRKTAAEALGKIGDAKATVPLIAAVDDENWSVRQAAVESLGKMGHAKAVDAVVNALRDGYSDVRQAAVTAAVQMGKPAVLALIKALSDDNPDTRRCSAEALGRMKDQSSIPALLTGWETGTPACVSPPSRPSAESETAAPLSGWSPCSRMRDSSVRWAAARALGDIGNLEAVGPLTLAFKDANSGVRWAAYKAADSICRRFNTQDQPPRID